MYTSLYPNFRKNVLLNLLSYFNYDMGLLCPRSAYKTKQKVALRSKITALYSQLAFEGKGVRVKSVVTLRRADTSSQHKTNKKSKYCFWENGMNAAPDTVKQTT